MTAEPVLDPLAFDETGYARDVIAYNAMVTAQTELLPCPPQSPHSFRCLTPEAAASRSPSGGIYHSPRAREIAIPPSARTGGG